MITKPSVAVNRETAALVWGGRGLANRRGMGAHVGLLAGAAAIRSRQIPTLRAPTWSASRAPGRRPASLLRATARGLPRTIGGWPRFWSSAPLVPKILDLGDRVRRDRKYHALGQGGLRRYFHAGLLGPTGAAGANGGFLRHPHRLLMSAVEVPVRSATLAKRGSKRRRRGRPQAPRVNARTGADHRAKLGAANQL